MPPRPSSAAEEQLGAMADACGEEARGPVTESMRLLLRGRGRQVPPRHRRLSVSKAQHVDAVPQHQVDEMLDDLAQRMRMRLQAAVGTAEFQRWVTTCYRQNQRDPGELLQSEFYSLCRKVLKLEDRWEDLETLFLSLEDGSDSISIKDIFAFTGLPFLASDPEAWQDPAPAPAKANPFDNIRLPSARRRTRVTRCRTPVDKQPPIFVTQPFRGMPFIADTCDPARPPGTKRWKPSSKEDRHKMMMNVHNHAEELHDIHEEHAHAKHRHSLKIATDAVVARRRMTHKGHFDGSGYSVDPNKRLSLCFSAFKGRLRQDARVFLDETPFDIVQFANEYNIPPTELAVIKRAYDKFDTNHDGCLDKDEFSSAVLSLIQDTISVEVSEQNVKRECRRHYQEADCDHNDGIDFFEFLTWFTHNRFNQDLFLSCEEKELRDLAEEHHMDIATVDQIKHCFTRCDTDNSGYIDIVEFERILNEIMRIPPDAELPFERVKFAWREIDIDGSGYVDFEEFLPWWSKRKQEWSPYEQFYRNIRDIHKIELDPPAKPVPSQDEIRWLHDGPERERRSTNRHSL